MVQVKTVLDTRRSKADGTYSIIFRITNVKKIYTLSSGISINKEFWDESKSEVLKSHPNHQSINTTLSRKYYLIQKSILKLEEDGEFSFDKLKSLISGKPKDQTDTSFKIFSEKLINDMHAIKRVDNAVVYQTALNRFLAYCGNPKIKFDEITYNTLDGFINSLHRQGIKQNSIANYLRSIRAIYNKAIKTNLVERSKYPFNDITIKTEKTQKRAINKVDLVKLESLNIKEETKEWHARNYFLLSYYLIGISFTDMAYLKKSNIVLGRIKYLRRKTKKLYSVKLFEKAVNILEHYSASETDYLLPIVNSKTGEDTLLLLWYYLYAATKNRSTFINF